MHWITVRFYEMGDSIIVSTYSIQYIINEANKSIGSLPHLHPEVNNEGHIEYTTIYIYSLKFPTFPVPMVT